MQRFTGLEYLYIDISNQWGLDKENWNTRIQWAKDNETRLEEIIATADDISLYVKAVKALIDTKAGRWTGFIMGLDATASGLQIMAAAIGCHDTAKQVNLIDTGKREDVYQFVADYMNLLPDVNVDRSTVKKPIMTTFYGSKAQPKKVFGDGTPELTAFYNILNTYLPGAMELMEDMQSCIDPEATSYQWTLPDGHVVVNTIMMPEDKRIGVEELNNHKFTHRMYTNQANPKDMSMAANIVHSIDGWIVREMIRRLNNKKIQIATIHDSFWAHPNNMNDVRLMYIQLLAEIANSDIIQSILREVTGDPSLQFRKLSNTLGKEILKSEYALS